MIELSKLGHLEEDDDHPLECECTLPLVLIPNGECKRCYRPRFTPDRVAYLKALIKKRHLRVVEGAT